jgi:hypothetical protein
MPALQIYGTLHFTMGAEIRGVQWRDYEGMYMITTGPIGIGNDYHFGNVRAGSVHDAVDLLLRSIIQVGTDQEALRNYLMQIHYDEGMSGPIAFDEMGNLTRRPVMTRILQGERIPIP